VIWRRRRVAGTNQLAKESNSGGGLRRIHR
jgi:hypothetical protein